MLLISLLLLIPIVLGATPAQWRSRIVYQVMVDRFARTDTSTSAPCNTADRLYCGGSWQGLIQKLDYIQNMGFTAIWISPITQQIQGQTIDGSSFHGYWQNNINALNSAFGSESDLLALSAAIHARGMYLMLDVVVNHFAWPGAYNTADYSTYIPFNSSSFFHNYCPITQQDYDSNQTAVEDCWLGSNAVELTDVDTNSADIMAIYNAWIKNLVSTYSIDGLRIDTAKHVQQTFYPGFIAAAGVYSVGEVFDGDPNYTCPYQIYLDGTLNYPLFYPLTRAFQSTNGSIADLVNMINQIKATCKDSTLLGTFLENHDNPRFPSLTEDMALAENAIAFTLLADGIPIIYEGQEQHYNGSNDPYNREAVWLSGYSTSAPLYQFIASVNQLRNRAIAVDPKYVTYEARPIYSDNSTIAVRKGCSGAQVIGVFSNKGSNGASYTQTIVKTGFTAGEKVVEVLGCTISVVGYRGAVAMNMGHGAAKIFYPLAHLAGTEICGH